MSEWKEYKIGDICVKIGSGATPSGGKGAYLGGDYSLIRSQNVLDNGFTFSGLAKIDDAQAKKLEGVSVEEQDLLLNITGDSVARSCMVDAKALPARVNQHVAIIRPDKNKANPKFILAWLQYKKPELLNLASFGGTRNAITKKMIQEFPILLPDLKRQYEIAAILSSLDDKIETNRAINARLEELASAIFKSWFIDFEPFADDEFVEDEYGRRPKEWKFLSLGDITSQCTQKVNDRNDVRVLSPITSGELVLSDEFFTKQVYSKELNKYIIVEPNAFAYNPARINIGSIGINEFNFDGCVSPVYVVFKTIPNYENFVKLFIQSTRFKDEVVLRAIGGVRQTLNYKDFSLIYLIVPPLEVIEDFNRVYNSIFVQIKNIKEENERLASLRDTLLPRLMSGELIPE